MGGEVKRGALGLVGRSPCASRADAVLGRPDHAVQKHGVTWCHLLPEGSEAQRGLQSFHAHPSLMCLVPECGRVLSGPLAVPQRRGGAGRARRQGGGQAQGRRPPVMAFVWSLPWSREGQLCPGCPLHDRPSSGLFRIPRQENDRGEPTVLCHAGASGVRLRAGLDAV